jgi:hypothetical protein
MSRLRDLLTPETDQEMTLLLGLGLIAVAFVLAQIIGSILYLPLSLLVPGAVLTLAAITARPEKPT